MIEMLKLTLCNARYYNLLNLNIAVTHKYFYFVFYTKKYNLTKPDKREFDLTSIFFAFACIYGTQYTFPIKRLANIHGYVLIHNEVSTSHFFSFSF